MKNINNKEELYLVDVKDKNNKRIYSRILSYEEYKKFENDANFYFKHLRENEEMFKITYYKLEKI